MQYTIKTQDYVVDKVKNGFTYLKNIHTGVVIPFSNQDLKNYNVKIKQ